MWGDDGWAGLRAACEGHAHLTPHAPAKPIPSIQGGNEEVFAGVSSRGATENHRNAVTLISHSTHTRTPLLGEFLE